MQALFLDPVWSLALAGVLGLCAGSFLNVVIHRFPRMLDREWQAQCAELRGETPPAGETYNLVVPRSACPACSHPIAAWENIPLASWLLLRGRCSSCRAPISARYPLVEALTGLLSVLVLWRLGPGLAAWAAVGLTWALVALAFIDLDTQLLPDDITLPLLWAGLLLNLLGGFVPLADAVVGAMAGYLTLWTVYWGFRLATGKEGMGFGDFKLLAALGAWLGWKMLPVIVLLSSVVGAVAGISMIAFRGGGRSVPIPFGPYLAAAGLIALLWGPDLVRAYLGP